MLLPYLKCTFYLTYFYVQLNYGFNIGFPSNNFAIMPTNAISYLTSLERFDISNNRVEVLSASDFQVKKIV